MAPRTAASKTQNIFGWFIALGVLSLIAYTVTAVVQDTLRPHPLVAIGKATFRADLAISAKEQERGLAGRTSLGADQAMLFVFDHDKRWSFWMKGMKMPIDIIWLDAEKKVVHVESDVATDAEPYVTYRPPTESRYALEVRAGAAAEYGIGPGSQAVFDLGGAR